MKVVALSAFLLAGLLAPAAATQSAAPKLSFPLACQPGRTCELQHYVDRDPGPGTRDYRCGLKTYDGHTAVDIRVPDMAAQRRGVAVLAAAAGKVLRTRDGVPDRTVGQPGVNPNDPQGCGNAVVIDHGGGWTTGYCHMARGSVRVKPGDVVRAGEPIGRVGMSGLTEFPHLHMDVRLNGKVVDPFAPDMSNPTACAAQAGLWTPAAAARMPYQAGAVLNAGFADGELTMTDVENAAVRPFSANAPWLVAYARAIALLPGDATEMVLKGPDGRVLAQARRPPLARWRAQDLHYVGKRRPPTGWAKGVYTAEYRVWRAGKPVLSRRLQVRL